MIITATTLASLGDFNVYAKGIHPSGTMYDSFMVGDNDSKMPAVAKKKQYQAHPQSTLQHPASNGASTGYTIQHPYMFVTNSRSEDRKATFSYRNHWHVPYKDYAVPYLKANLTEDESHIMFNAWNTNATEPGQKKVEQIICKRMQFLLANPFMTPVLPDSRFRL